VQKFVIETVIEIGKPCSTMQKIVIEIVIEIYMELEMWANAQRDGRPAEYRWRPLFNAAKFG